MAVFKSNFTTIFCSNCELGSNSLLPFSPGKLLLQKKRQTFAFLHAICLNLHLLRNWICNLIERTTRKCSTYSKCIFWLETSWGYVCIKYFFSVKPFKISYQFSNTFFLKPQYLGQISLDAWTHNVLPRNENENG